MHSERTGPAPPAVQSRSIYLAVDGLAARPAANSCGQDEEDGLSITDWMRSVSAPDHQPSGLARADREPVGADGRKTSGDSENGGYRTGHRGVSGVIGVGVAPCAE